MGQDRQDQTGHSSGRRASVREAAELLGTTVDAIRKRVQRDTIPYEKAPDGRVWILLDTNRTRQDTDQDTAGHRQDDEPGALTSELRDRLRYVEGQLEAERQAHAEARRIIAGLVERIPAIEAPASPEARESPETVEEQQGRGRPHSDRVESQEGVQRPWWRRLIGS